MIPVLRTSQSPMIECLFKPNTMRPSLATLHTKEKKDTDPSPVKERSTKTDICFFGLLRFESF